MKRIELFFAAALAFAAPATALAQEAQAEAMSESPLITEADSLAQFVWVKRPVVVFADSPNDPRFIQQMDLLNDRKQDLFDRDVVVVTDTDPSANTPLRQRLRPRGFMLVLIGKDGEIKLRKPSPWHVRELTRSIDKMPLRKQEIRDAKNAAGQG